MPLTHHDGDFARWVKKMTDAGWSYFAWIDGGSGMDTNIMWRHRDEYEAAITQGKARRYFLDDVIPDPYEVLDEASCHQR